MNRISVMSFSVIVPLVTSLYAVNVSAKNLGDYVFPPLEKMENSVEQKYTPETYMSYSSHNNSSFFQQSDYVFPEIEKPVAKKPVYPSIRDYAEETDQDRRENNSAKNDYPYKSKYSSVRKTQQYAPTNNWNQSNKLSKSNQYTNYNSKEKYSYPNYSPKYSSTSTTSNDFFNMNNWNPMSGKFPQFPGMGNSSMFNSKGMTMPNFF